MQPVATRPCYQSTESAGCPFLASGAGGQRLIKASGLSDARFREEVKLCAASAARAASFNRSNARCGIFKLPVQCAAGSYAAREGSKVRRTEADQRGRSEGHYTIAYEDIFGA
jgi:hypothetical protein